jgi:outer membrane murein-binding lipoprotein Lpp
MPICPHCGQEIRPPQSPIVPWWKLDLAPHSVNLGCGSLMLVAIIVAFCSGGFGMSGKIDHLGAEIKELEKKIDKVDQNIGQMEKKQ